MSETFDFSEYDAMFDEANASSRDRSEPFKPKSGPATLEVVKMGRGQTKKGDGKIWSSLRIVDGHPQTGEVVFKSWYLKKVTDPTTGKETLDPKQLRDMLTDFKTMGVKGIEKIEDLNDDAKLATSYGNRIAGSITVTDAAKNFYNVKLNKRVAEAGA